MYREPTTPTQQPEPETFTVTQMARRLGISEKTVYKQVAQGRFPIPALRIGRMIRFSRRDVEAFIRSDSLQ